MDDVRSIPLSLICIEISVGLQPQESIMQNLVVHNLYFPWAWFYTVIILLIFVIRVLRPGCLIGKKSFWGGRL